MKTKLAAAAAVMGLAFAGSALASPIDGLWLTQEKDGVIQIYECGADLCGKIVDSERIRADASVADSKNHDPALRGRPLKGLAIMTGFTGGPPEWKGGQIYNPEDGGTYKGSIHMSDPQTLKLKGCWAFICQTQVWHKQK